MASETARGGALCEDAGAGSGAGGSHCGVEDAADQPPAAVAEDKAARDVTLTHKIRLVSQEGEVFVVEPRVALMSELVKNMVVEEEERDDDGDDVQEIPLPNVKAAVLGKVIEYCNMHKDTPMSEIEKPLSSVNMVDVVQQQFAAYIDGMQQEMLFEIILAANYMDITPLLELSCAKVATMIKGKTPDQIRKTFNIVNDFSPEEEAAVMEENKWCEEA